MAPHTLNVVIATNWDRRYNREQAGMPAPWCQNKVWPSVGRLDDQYGDKNLICTCPPVQNYASPYLGNESDKKKAAAGVH